MILDTPVFISYINGESKAVRIVDDYRGDDKDIAISAVTLSEVLSDPKISESDRLAIHTFSTHALIVSVTADVAERAAELRRASKLSTEQCIIAATALNADVPLATKDIKLFHKIKGLKIIRA